MDLCKPSGLYLLFLRDQEGRMVECSRRCATRCDTRLYYNTRDTRLILGSRRCATRCVSVEHKVILGSYWVILGS